MNYEAIKLETLRQEEMKRLGGLEAYRLQALRNLKLKTVVKESHCTAVHALAFNHCAPQLNNLFATVGKDQATVYDDEHMSDHVGVVVHFVNSASEHAPGGELQAAAWLSADGWAEQPAGDACLAVAGQDPNISVISVVEARVVLLLQGHSSPVVELAAAGAGAPRLLLSLSRDGNLRLWDVASEACLSTLQTDAISIALAPDGCSLVTGSSKGKLHRYQIAAAAADGSSSEQQEQQRVGILGSSKQELNCQGSSHSAGVDCIRYLPGNRLATKSTDGRMFVWGLEDMEAAASWKVPNCQDGGLAGRCQFGCTPDGKYIAAGSSSGDCFVYDSESGVRVGRTSPYRVTGPVRACGLSADCRHLLAVLGNGFVFRYEYLGPLEGEEGQEDKENGDAAQQQQQQQQQQGGQPQQQQTAGSGAT